MARRGVEHPDEVKVRAVHRVLVLGAEVAATAREMGVSPASIRNWAKQERLVRLARAIDPPAAPPAHPEIIPAGTILLPDPEMPDWALEPSDADPLQPGPVTRRILAAAYRLTTRLETLDDLVQWPRGCCALWFEDAEGGDDIERLQGMLDGSVPRRSHELVRDLRRARALADLGLIAKAVDCGKGAFMAMALLKVRRPSEFDPDLGSGGPGDDPLAEYSDAEIDAIIEAARP